MDKKPVNAVVEEPFLHVVDDLDRRADQRPLAARPGEPFIELADGQFLLTRPAKHISHRGLAAEHAVMLRDFRQRPEETGFEPSVPRQIRSRFESSPPPMTV